MATGNSLSFSELVAREARALATDHLRQELLKVDLPLPKDSALEIHVEQLVKVHPEFTITAKERVAAYKDAYTEALRAVGVELPPRAAPVDIELDLSDDI